MPMDLRSASNKDVSNNDASNKNVSNNELRDILLAAITRNTDMLDGMQNQLNEVTDRVSTLETNFEDVQTNHDSLKLTVSEMQRDINDLKTFKKDQVEKVTAAENKAVMAEYHQKKYNSILYNWPESKAWESPEDSRKELNKFFKDVLGIDDPDSIMIANCHRLGTVSENKDDDQDTSSTKKKSRPLIFRAIFWKDRNLIIEKSQTILKTYNARCSTKYGVSQQLPKRMQENKKSLTAEFREARQNKLKVKWRIDYTNAIYYLSVNGKDVKPKA